MEDTAFFRFDSNANDVATDIIGAMERINRALSSPAPSGEVGANVSGLSQMFSRVEDDVRNAKRQVDDLIRQFNAGLIDKPTFTRDFQQIVRGNLGQLPITLAQELGNTKNQTIAARAPIQKIARELADASVATLVGQVEQTLGDAVGKQFYQRTSFKKERGDLDVRPVAYESELLNREQQLRNQLRAEELIAMDPGMGVGTMQRAKELGFSQRYMRDLGDQVRYETDEGYAYESSDAKAELSQLIARQREGEQTASRLRREEKAGEQQSERSAQAWERESEKVDRLASSYEALDRAGRRVGSRMVFDDGSVERITSAGNVPELNPLQRRIAREGAAEQERKEIESRLAAQEKADQRTIAARSKEEQAAVKYARWWESALQQKEAAEDRSLRAQEALTEGYQRAGSRVVRPDGTVERVTTRGNVVEENPLLAQDARDRAAQFDQEVAHGRRLAENFRDVMDVGGYSVLQGEVYRLNQHGAARITNEYTVKKVLDQQSDILTQQALKMQRLNELDSKRALRADQHGGGMLTGFMNRWHRGDQSVTNSLGGQMASAAAFSLAYGSLFTLQAAIRDTLNEVVDYQDSLTDLEVATRSTDVVTGDWINTLSEMSRLSGDNVGAALDTAARGVRAFGDVAGSTKEEIQAIGSATNEAATMLALIANKDLRDSTGDVISVGSAFGLEPDQLNQVVDAVANAKRALGGDPAQIAQGLSLIAGTAQEAGYNLNEAAAIISLVQARTDQSGQAISTRLSRIFQIISGGTGKKLAQELGVDSSQSIKDQIEAFAGIYANTDSEAIKDRISSALGGTANLRELLPLLEEQQTLQAAYSEAINNSGQGTDEFNRKTENLVGTLKQIGGTIKNIQVDLARSGLLTPFGALLEVLEPALNGFDQLLRLYDSMTEKVPGLQEVLAVTLEIALAAKAISAVQNANSLFGMPTPGSRSKGDPAMAGIAIAMAAEAQGINLSAAERAAAEQKYIATVLGSAERRAGAEAVASTAAAGGVGGAGKKAGMLGGLASLGRFLINPATIAVAGTVATLALVDKWFKVQNQRENFMRDRNGAMQAYGRIDGTSASVRKAAEDLRSTIGELKKTDALMGNDDIKKQSISLLKAEAEALEGMAKRVEQEEALAAAQKKTTVFGDGAIDTVDELANGLSALSAQGANARTQMEMLTKALTTEAPKDRGRIFSPERDSAQIVGAIIDSIEGAIPEGTTRGIVEKTAAAWVITPYAAGGIAPVPGGTIMAPDEVNKKEAIDLAHLGVDVKKMRKAVMDEAQRLGVGLDDPISEADFNQLVEAAGDALGLGLLPDIGEQVRRDAVNAAIAELGGERNPFADHFSDLLGMPVTGKERQGLLNGRGRLNRGQVLSLFQSSEDGEYIGLSQLHQNDLAGIPESDDGTMLRKIQRDYIKLLKQIAKRYKGPELDLLNDELTQAERDLRISVDERLEQARKVAQSAPGLSKRAIRAIGRDFLYKRIVNAGGDAKLLIQIMESADQQSLDIVEAKLREAVEVAKAAAALHANLMGIAGGMFQIAAALPAVANLLAFQDARGQSNVTADPFGGMAGGEGSAIYNPEKSKEDKEKKAQDRRNAAADLISAKAEAHAANLGGGLANAKAQLISARARLNAQKKGTTEWYQALAGLFQAQEAMSNAVADYAAIRDRLHGDITDPVENARDALRDARRRLAMDRRSGAGKDVIAEDRLAVRESRSGLAGEKFQQRFNDMQTAEELGRISFQKYMNYLDSEHDRLSRIKHRTRQQQDQLDQVDRAMKEAASQMEGQWNLGDINTNGLVYKVRRFKAEQQAQRASAQASATTVVQNQQDVSIQINGADTARVRKIIEDYVGGAGRVRTPQPRRRR